LDENLNKLVELETSLSPKIYLGKFPAREEFLINFKEKTKAYFFVVNGSFEANGMLLHNRDSASFVEIESLDFESLSSESIVVVIVE
jgi:Quercetinase C-terminal cupin domain